MRKILSLPQVGYHGNTNACVDVSSYKFDGKGRRGKPEYTHIFPLPDAFRGKYRGNNSGVQYAEDVQKCIETILKKGRRPAGMIIRIHWHSAAEGRLNYQKDF
ncbi:MAG: hypothetical protein U5K51_10925 [Flavobacteriaceae bacterium]|nr:hypothetical protein [Flavobacteriaceae bacterium]